MSENVLPDPLPISTGDSPSIDAFARLRISNPHTLLIQSKFMTIYLGDGTTKKYLVQVLHRPIILMRHQQQLESVRQRLEKE